MSPVSGLTNVCERVFTADGTFTVPTGALLIQAFIVGGGGGGGGGVADAGPQSGGGGGGGGGYYVVAQAPTGAATNFAITVGGGGTAGTAGGFTAGGDGGSGQDSSVNWGPSSITAVGGGGGVGATIPGVVAAGSGGANGPLADRRNGGAGATNGGGGGGGGNDSAGADGDANDGGDGGAGARPASSQILFGNLTSDYGGGGGGGADGAGGGNGGSGGGGAGGSAAAGTVGTANTGGGGGGGGVSGGGGQAGAAGGSGLVIIRVSFGSVIAAPVASLATEISLTLVAGEGVTCSITSVGGRRGEWVALPAADSCSGVDGTSNTVVLGWATSASFPVAIAQRQVDNGWGAYETVDNDGRLTSVFIPAGGSTLLSASGSLFAISSG